MATEARRRVRRPIDCEVVISWQDRQGAQFVRTRGVDLSELGVRVEAEVPLAAGAHVFVRAPDYGLGGSACVRHCARRGAKYIIGLELSRDDAGTGPAVGRASEDYYELLQISPTAEMQTIQRVYKILAARYHPDNPHTGDAERFLRLTQAYETLSDPEKRTAYDSGYRDRSFEPLPVFELKEFVTGVDVEANRRMGMLCLLYNRRRANPDRPGLSLLDFESLMAIPREHLGFTLWFLKEKRYLRFGDNSEAEISAEGVELVESSLPASSVLRRLVRPQQEEETVSPESG